MYCLVSTVYVLLSFECKLREALFNSCNIQATALSGPPSPEDCFHRFHHATAILITTLLRKMRDSKYPQGVYGYVLPVCPFMASFLFSAVAWKAALWHHIYGRVIYMVFFANSNPCQFRCDSSPVPLRFSLLRCCMGGRSHQLANMIMDQSVHDEHGPASSHDTIVTFEYCPFQIPLFFRSCCMGGRSHQLALFFGVRFTLRPDL